MGQPLDHASPRPVRRRGAPGHAPDPDQRPLPAGGLRRGLTKKRGGGDMRRQKKFYAWGYADEDLTPEEIKPWEAEIAERYGVKSFDVAAPPKAAEITLRTPRVEVPSALQSIVRTDHL